MQSPQRRWKTQALQCKRAFSFLWESQLPREFLNQLVTNAIGACGSARHDDQRKLYTHVLEMRATRCPCGSGDKAQLKHHTKLPKSAGPGLGVTAKRLLTLQSNHSSGNQSLTPGLGVGVWGWGGRCRCSRLLKKVLL